jgi:hypothetical protein
MEDAGDGKSAEENEEDLSKSETCLAMQNE